MNILENLLGYNNSFLNGIDVGGIEYRTKFDFEPKVCLGLAFGTSGYNGRLAETIFDAEKYFGGMKVIAQKEIYDLSLSKNIIPVGESPKGGVPTLKSDIGTREILELSLPYIIDDEKSNILFVAHPAHIYRVMKMGEKLGLQGHPFIEKKVFWSDPDDKQIWTRSPVLYAPREIAVRMILSKRGQF